MTETCACGRQIEPCDCGGTVCPGWGHTARNATRHWCGLRKEDGQPRPAETHGPGCYCPDCNAERREEALDAAEMAADRRKRLDIDAPEANG